MRSALLHANAHGPSRALLVPIEGKVEEVSVRARHGVQVVVDVVPVAQGVPPPPQREVGVLKEQQAIQHNLLVDLRPGSLATTSRSRTQLQGQGPSKRCRVASHLLCLCCDRPPPPIIVH